MAALGVGVLTYVHMIHLNLSRITQGRSNCGLSY